MDLCFKHFALAAVDRLDMRFPAQPVILQVSNRSITSSYKHGVLDMFRDGWPPVVIWKDLEGIQMRANLLSGKEKEALSEFFRFKLNFKSRGHGPKHLPNEQCP